MRLKRTTAIACGGALMLLAGYWLLQRGAGTAQGGRTDTTLTTTAPTPTAAANAASRPGSGPTVGTAPTPASTATLPELWETLEASALAGDGPSACRLAMETLRCAMSERHRFVPRRAPGVAPEGTLESLEAFVADPTGIHEEVHRAIFSGPDGLERWERMQQLNREFDEHCGGVASERRDDAFAFLRQSALAGVPDAQAVYAAWGAGMFGLMPGAMAEPTFERWLEEAPTVLQRMLDTGHPDAPLLLSQAYGRDQFHGWLFPYDPVRSVAYGQLELRISQVEGYSRKFVEIRRQALPPSQREQADRLTADLYAKHYAGRTAARGEKRAHMPGIVRPKIGIGISTKNECELAPHPEEAG